jgi:hypothetical protein
MWRGIVGSAINGFIIIIIEGASYSISDYMCQQMFGGANVKCTVIYNLIDS